MGPGPCIISRHNIYIYTKISMSHVCVGLLSLARSDLQELARTHIISESAVVLSM